MSLHKRKSSLLTASKKVKVRGLEGVNDEVYFSIGGEPVLQKIASELAAECNNGSVAHYKNFRLVSKLTKKVSDSAETLLLLDFSSMLHKSIPQASYRIIYGEGKREKTEIVRAVELGIDIGANHIVTKCANLENNSALLYYGMFAFHNSTNSNIKDPNLYKFSAAMCFYKYFNGGGKPVQLTRINIILLGARIFTYSDMEKIISMEGEAYDCRDEYIVVTYAHINSCNHLRIYIAKLCDIHTFTPHSNHPMVPQTDYTYLPPHYIYNEKKCKFRLGCDMHLCDMSFRLGEKVSRDAISMRFARMALYTIINLIRENDTDIEINCEYPNIEEYVIKCGLIENVRSVCESDRKYEHNEFSIDMRKNYEIISTARNNYMVFPAK